MEIRTVRPFSREYRNAAGLYREAFPPEQRYSYFFLWLTAALRRPVTFRGYYDGSEFCGLSYTVDTGRYVYLFYLAVPARRRGRGDGSEILSLLRQRHPDRTILLDVEAPDPAADNKEQRQKRVEFYLRNGFYLLDRQVETEGHVQKIMSTSREFDSAEYWKAFRLMSLKTLSRIKKVQKLLHLWR